MNMFSKIKVRKPRKSKFNLSHEKKMSMKFGQLIPTFLQEVVPGDKIRMNSEIFLRMAPMLAPIMHRINVYTHYFFVPNRLIWDEWEDFITGGKDGTLAPVHPTIQMNQTYVDNGWFEKGSLADYLGVPTIEKTEAIAVNQSINMLPFRAYQKIYNEYYRDQNLVDEVDINTNSGETTYTLNGVEHLKIRNRAWEKDYFTSALPWAQRGGDVDIPISGDGTVNYASQSQVLDTFGDPGADGKLQTSTGYLESDANGGIAYGARIENIDSVQLESAGVNINELRRSLKLQEWLEKNARGGARYIEQMLVHFGVMSSDARLQRPEYLGGGKQPVSISEVVSTYEDPSSPTAPPQGNMAGHGVSVGRSTGFARFFEEHGFVIGITSVVPKPAYQQGLHKMWTRADKFDYYWPEFANLGEQEITMSELYCDPKSATYDPTKVFGYAPRYSEYKYQPSTVHGEMRDSLSFWHLGRIFENEPALAKEFVEIDPEKLTRIFAVETGEHMYCQLYNKVDAIRPMPYFGTPTL